MAATARVQSLFLSIFLVLGFLCSISDAGKGRIVGGIPTHISTAPYAVSIHRGIHTCGGALITSRHVLTAAHCVYKRRPEEFKVYGGSTYANYGDGELRSVNAIITPSNYISDWNHLDVAVLHLSAPMTGQNIKTIPLCSRSMPEDAIVKVSGWGSIKEGGQSSIELRSVDLRVIKKANCEASYYRARPITDAMFCASSNGKDSCQGDSGGPAVWNNQVCGIVSFGMGCARGYFPGVYTDVRKVLPFINEALSKKL